MQLSKIFIHDLRNDLLIMKFLVKKLDIENETTNKLNSMLDSVSNKCQMVLAPLNLHNGPLDIVQTIQEIVTCFPNIQFDFNFEEKIHFIANKIEFEDVLKNIIQNSIEAGGNSIKFETKFNSLIIRDDGTCSSGVVDNLNNAVIFTTKDTGHGIGTQGVKQFCDKHECRLLYSKVLKGDPKENNYSLIIRIKFP